MAARVSARLTPGQGREFGVKVGLAFVALAGLLLWRERSAAAAVAGSLGGVLVVGGLLAPRALGPVYRAWMGVAVALSKVTTPLFLGIVYFVILTPVGVLRRRLGARLLVRPLREGSYWVRRDTPGTSAKRMERAF